MQILIIGLNHQIQPAEIKSWSSSGTLQAFEQEQKENFASLLRSSIAERNVQFIAEEALHGQATIAKRVSDSVNCRHANIEMTPEERSARNIPPGYNEDESFPSSDRERCHREREAYMAEKTLAASGDSASAIVLCGRAHAERLAELFRKAGHTVETTDLLRLQWYVEDWMEHMRRNL